MPCNSPQLTNNHNIVLTCKAFLSKIPSVGYVLDVAKYMEEGI